MIFSAISGVSLFEADTDMLQIIWSALGEREMTAFIAPYSDIDAPRSRMKADGEGLLAVKIFTSTGVALGAKY